MGQPGCEKMALAKLHGEWEREKTSSLLVGSYVDAHFEGTLDVFKAQNPEIFTKSGSLKSEYQKADEVIQRIERDPYFMGCMNGKKQVIMTAELYGAKWKIKIDVLNEGKAIVDLKVMKSITEGFWVKDYGRVSFVEFWGYDIQACVYQAVVQANVGADLPFLLAVASKEKFVDIEVIGFNKMDLKVMRPEIETNVNRILALKSGAVEPTRCGVCDYCKFTKVLSAPIHYSEILQKV
jgi:hypothetical protein